MYVCMYVGFRIEPRDVFCPGIAGAPVGLFPRLLLQVGAAPPGIGPSVGADIRPGYECTAISAWRFHPGNATCVCFGPTTRPRCTPLVCVWESLARRSSSRGKTDGRKTPLREDGGKTDPARTSVHALGSCGGDLGDRLPLLEGRVAAATTKWSSRRSPQL